LIKNFRNKLLNNQAILPKYLVESNNLKCNIVSSDCIKFLVDFQENSQMKLQPKLSKVNISPTLHQKMRVNLAVNVSIETIAAIPLIKDKLESTAAFLKVIHHWFQIISSKSPEYELNENSNHLKTNEEFPENFIRLIEQIQFTKNNKWKPFQTGFILTTKSILGLFHYLEQQY
jgi:hypothetical protein